MSKGLTVGQVEKILARLATLFGIAIHLISSKSRDQRVIDLLLDALQLFKDNKLADVSSRRDLKASHDSFRRELRLKEKETRKWRELVRLTRLQDFSDDRDLSVKTFCEECEASRYSGNSLRTPIPGCLEDARITTMRALVQMSAEDLKPILYPKEESRAHRMMRPSNRIEVLTRYLNNYGLTLAMTEAEFDAKLDLIAEA